MATVSNNSAESSQVEADAADEPGAHAWRYLLLILLTGALLRGAILPWFAGLSLHNDEQDYDELATSIVERGEFATAAGQITSIRPPLYPAFLAGAYRLFGLKNWQAARALQAALSLVTVLLVYAIARRLYDARTGLVAAALACFYPSLLVYNNLLLSEALFTFWLTAFVLVMTIYLTPRRAPSHENIHPTSDWPLLAVAGLILGLAASTRSVLWLFPPVAAAFVLVAPIGRISYRAAGGGALVIAFVLVILPWTIRNTRLEKTLITIDCMGGRNLMMGNYEYTPPRRAWDAIGVTGDRAWYRVLRNRYPEFPTLTQGQRDKLAMREGIRFVVAHPGLTLQRDTIKFFNFWQLEREIVSGAAAGQLGPVPKLAIPVVALVIFGGYAAAILLAIFAIVLDPPRARLAHYFVLLIVAFVCAMHTLVFAHSRYHLPLMPLLLIYTARAATDWLALWARRGERRFLLAAGCALVLVGGWVFEIVTVDFQRFIEALRG